MEKLTGYERKVAMRSFIVVLFRLELITASELVGMGSRSWSYELTHGI